MLKKSASGVLASFRSSTGTRPPHPSAARTDVVLLIRRTVRPRGYASGFDSPAALPGTRRVLARQGWAGEKAAFLSILLRFGLNQGPSLIPEGEHTDPYDDHGEGKELAHGEGGKDKTNVSIRFANKLNQHPA